MKSEILFVIVNLLGLILNSAAFDLSMWEIILVQTVMPLTYNAWHWPHQIMKMLDTNLKDMVRMGINNIELQFGIKSIG